MMMWQITHNEDAIKLCVMIKLGIKKKFEPL